MDAVNSTRSLSPLSIRAISSVSPSKPFPFRSDATPVSVDYVSDFTRARAATRPTSSALVWPSMM